MPVRVNYTATLKSARGDLQDLSEVGFTINPSIGEATESMSKGKSKQKKAQ
jgi:hypothetical protein